LRAAPRDNETGMGRYRGGGDRGKTLPRRKTCRERPRVFDPTTLKIKMEVPMKLSARNILKGKITDVKKGQTTTHVLIDIGGSIVTSSITNEAADELKLAKGQSAYAVIKASDVMVGK
jgi:molybdopterin-binding protein